MSVINEYYQSDNAMQFISLISKRRSYRFNKIMLDN